MASELIAFGDREVLLPPQYFGSVGYYAVMAAYGRVCIDSSMTADKRFKSAHRCRIVDTRDEILLIVPVSHPHGRHTWSETIVSTHGKWWNNHLTALESAYGRTPFFEFYIDRFKPLFDSSRYEDEKCDIARLDSECDAIVREILMIDNDIRYDAAETCTDNVVDLRRADFGTIGCVTEYYQIRADRLGFRSGLSVLDLIFNVGTEAPLILKRIIDGMS